MADEARAALWGREWVYATKRWGRQGSMFQRVERRTAEKVASSRKPNFVAQNSFGKGEFKLQLNSRGKKEGKTQERATARLQQPDW